MISIKKLESLPYKTRLRKIVLTLQSAEQEINRGQIPDRDYLCSVINLIRREPRLSSRDRDYFESLYLEFDHRSETPSLQRTLNRLRHLFLKVLNAEPAEWDLLIPGTDEIDPQVRTVFPFGVYLEEIRSPYNVGAIFRAAEAFGVERIFLSAATPSPLHPRALKTSRGAESAVPWQFEELQSLAEAEGVFALELGGTPIEAFNFPLSGIVLIGSEELGLSPEALKLAESKAGRVAIPMAGAKRSLNVSVAFGIVMHAWFNHVLKEKAERALRDK